MSAGTLKQILVELTRGGCRVERLAHNPPVVTFRSPRGERCSLTSGLENYRLSQGEKAQSAIFGSLHEAIRAACLS